jgi:iron(III) transport system substrate-binding protein
MEPVTESLAHVNRRQFLKTAAVGVASLAAGPALLEACGGAGSNSNSGSQHFIATPDVEKAKKEGTVVLYTSLDTLILEAINKGFTDKYGIKVEYFRGGSVDATNKALSESTAGQNRVDVIDASDVASFIVMKQKGLLRPYDSPETKTVASNLRDKDNYWVADRLTQGVIEYNTKLVSDPPQHWKDLADPRFMSQLAYFSASNGDGAPRIYTLVQSLGWGLIESYAKNKPLRVDTPQLITQIVERGERAASFVQNDNIAWRSKLSGKSTDYVYPSEGVPTELGAVGVAAKAPHPNAALLYYNYWMSRDGQQLLVDGGKYSSRSDMPPPKGSKPVKDIKLLVLNYDEYQKNKQEILNRMTKIFGGEWGA